MKSSRRHELQTNTLAKVITGAPTWWSEQGPKTVFLIVAALLVGFLIRYRINSSRETAMHASAELANARSLINELKQMEPWRGMPAEQLAAGQRQVSAQAATSIENALNDTKDRRVKAEALVARGDLNWLLASAGEVAASTQPSLTSARSKDDYLSTAAESYQSVLDSYSDLKDSAIAAHFGLGAIAEDRADWEAAKNQYSAVANDADATDAYKLLANRRFEELKIIQKPALLVPTTMKAGTTMATSGPATKPVAIPVTTRATTQAVSTQPK